ncbi:MAG: adenosylcobinamide-GDP ribazoletransferase [Desulfamplus sp.]|nr:adenosylcobinamide-GDP ribazoletransferase [Desulfamplus sp.]
MDKNDSDNFRVDLRSAILFMTVIPAGRQVSFSPSGMIRFFPVVGLMLGFLMLCSDLIASLFWQPPVVALMDVLILILLTGAFHIDGLGDTADGIFSHRSRKRALDIMKDSRIGMMGLVTVFSCLALKVAGIYSVKEVCSGIETALILLIVPAYARAGMLFGIRSLKYGRAAGGTGHGFFQKKLPPKDFFWILIPAGLSLFLGFRGLLLNVVFALSLFLILMFYRKKMGCITGDMLGAMTEVMESTLFITAGMAL